MEPDAALVQQRIPDDWTAEIAELDRHRTAHEWTWQQLADAMEKRGVGVSPRTLHYVCKRLPLDGRPIDRTLSRIRKYLAYARAADQRAEVRRRRVTA